MRAVSSERKLVKGNSVDVDKTDTRIRGLFRLNQIRLSVGGLLDESRKGALRKPDSVNNLEHALVLSFLLVLAVDKEDDMQGTLCFGEVAQVEECVLRESLDVGIAEPDKESLSLLVQDAWVSPESVSALKAELDIKVKESELPSSQNEHRSQWKARLF